MSKSPPIIAFQPPVGAQLRFYNRAIPASQQSSAIPSTFCHSMVVREAVFVNEMGAVPVGHHTDRDDARSCHWVIHSPAPGTSSPSSSSDTRPQPIGTIRLVPYPHYSHPEEGARFEAPGSDIPVEDSESLFTGPIPKYALDRPTSLHDGKEPYLKLGRLSVIKKFRGNKLADVLIQAALKWAAENPSFSKEQLEEQDVEVPEWKGLVCAHAQEKAVSTWTRNGFQVDEGIGNWFEAGMKHFLMFTRVKLRHS